MKFNTGAQLSATQRNSALVGIHFDPPYSIHHKCFHHKVDRTQLRLVQFCQTGILLKSKLCTIDTGWKNVRWIEMCGSAPVHRMKNLNEKEPVGPVSRK